MQQTKLLQVLYLAHGIFMLASIMLVPLFALFATEIGASVLIVGYLGSVFFITKAVGTIFMRFYGDRISNKKAILFCSYLLKSFGWFCFIASGSILTLFIIQAILGLSEGIQSPAFRTLVGQSIHSGHEVAEYANWEIILALTGIIGTTAGGIIVSQYGFQTLFIIMGTLSAISAILVVHTPKTN